MVSFRFLLLFLLCSSFVFCQWDGALNTVLNEDGYVLIFNREASGADPITTADTLTIPLDLSTYNTGCIEWWVFLSHIFNFSVNSLAPPQTMLFFGADPSSYIWVSAADGLSGSPGAGPLSVLKSKGINDSVAVTYSFQGFDRPKAWTHFAICLQPASAGQSYIFGLGNTFQNKPFYFSTNTTFKKIVGQTQLVIGKLSDNLQAEVGKPDVFTGRIGEIRIWNRFLSISELNTTRFTSLAANEPGLAHRWTFGEGAGTTFTDSVGNINGSLNGPVFARRNGSVSSFEMIPYYRFHRQIPWNGSVDINALCNSIIAQSGTILLPTYGNICDLNAQCSPLTGSTALIQANVNRYAIRYTPVRGSCGKTVSFSENAKLSVAAGPTNSVYMVIDVGNMTGVPSPGSADRVPTNGGSLTIRTPTTFGWSGNLVADEEFVNITFSNKTPIPCTNAMVDNNGALICSVPPGVGFNAAITMRLCGVIYTWPNLFSYQLPSVSNLSSIDFQTLSFTGVNFGPPRIFDRVTDSVIIYNQSTVLNCTVSSVTHSSLVCGIGTLFMEAHNYTANITIGGQTISYFFVFQKCNPFCQNGGICRTDSTCDCQNTGFGGSYCQNQLVCQPVCKNGGKCVVKNDGSNNVACDCPTGFQGTVDCAESNATGPPITAIIIGVVVGGSVFIIIAGSIVLVFLLKREKREGSTFIPLEKKDFTKIIYGDQLNQNPDKSAGNLQELEKLLVQDETLSVAFSISSITQITEADKIAKALVVIFQDNNKVIKLLEAFISEEVRTTESAGTLFRANSMVSKMFKFYSRLIGLPYLYVTIGPELGKLIEEELGLEVDPEKMEEGKDLDEMRWALMSQSQKILKQILISDDKCPPQFRSLFAHIAKCVGSRFPENVNTTIGGFIFLRLFCPAVSSPEAYGIVEEPPSPDSRRLLILITKVLQNLSNDVEFGSKEPYMTKMNDFIQSNRLKLITFYEKLLKPPTKPPVVCDMPKNIKPLNLIILAQHIRDNLDKIEDAQIKTKLKSVLPPE